MKSDAKKNDLIALLASDSDADFKGYTMEELQKLRLAVRFRKEVKKEQAIKECMKIKNQVPVINGKPVFSGVSSKGIMGKVFSGLNLFDYLILGFQALRIGKKVGTIFKRNK